MYNFIIFMVCTIFLFNCSLIVGLFIIFKLWGYRARRLTLKHTCLASCHKPLTAHELTVFQIPEKKEFLTSSEQPLTMLTPFLYAKPLSIGHFIARGIYCQKNHVQKDEHV